jgi:2-polyprenyl-3-methyl-5-hydroxy-6-metoxy-1,4-benzoquinol methylase
MPEERPRDAVTHFSGYVEQFDALYRDRPDFDERLGIWHELLEPYVATGATAIDMGCGTGVFSFYLAGRGVRVIGVDGAPGMIKFCEERRSQQGLNNIRFVEAKLPHVDETQLEQADLVISSSVVEYVERLDDTFALFARVLKPGGILILSMPSLLSVSRAYERLKYALTGEPNIYAHIRHFSTPSRLERQVRGLGLTLLQSRYYAHPTRVANLSRKLLLPPAMTEDLFVAVFRKASHG